jgi:Protein of unknown function (DUF2849)
MTLQIVTANRLTDGRVVYLAEGERWVEALRGSRIAHSDDEAKTLLAIGEDAAKQRHVVAPYLIDVVVEDGRVWPVRYREVLRAVGPSTHPEFNRVTVEN